MKRKITSLEQKLLNDGWLLTIKHYTGNHSEKILHYEYHKTSDLRNDNKTYDLFINLDQKRSQIVKYGIANLFIERMGNDELMVVRFLFLELRHYVERLEKPSDLVNLADALKQQAQDILFETTGVDVYQEPSTPEQFDELCKENE